MKKSKSLTSLVNDPDAPIKFKLKATKEINKVEKSNKKISHN